MSYLCYPVLMNFPSYIGHIWRLDCIINANTGHIFNFRQFFPHPIVCIIKHYNLLVPFAANALKLNFK